ncbi:MAG: heme anaerobic degradation radical SAM methyltransferase ChuW/HutW, partial [Paracoccus sp. (in: a-proteobacteria)]|uniref:heme anaerobic degradation radical SAM methyltransferase ChuW/HutW n=1 Tax=Paracoccus sp. TaxID=267 RepID=UPI0026E0FC37
MSARPQITAPAGPPTVEGLFAETGGDPLASAFPGKRAVHPFIGMVPVPEAQVAANWAGLHGQRRKERAVGYVHVPFCENHCLFCGFYQNAWRARDGGPYVDAVIAQLRGFAATPAAEGPPLQAVYLGGGTPTALAGRDLARLIAAIRRYLPLTPDCEITLEGRIHSFGRDKALAAYDAGATRISLGVQSFTDSIRKPLGRKASRGEVISLLDQLVALDRGAVVIDLIYGLPGQTPEHVAADVRLCAELGLDGLDLYSLNLIGGTPLLAAIEKGKMIPAPAPTLGTYFAAGEAAAEESGWVPISTTHWQGSLRERNVYNLAVKTGADCLPFGAGAGGFLNGFNYRITSDLDDFAARGGDAGHCLTRGMMRQPAMAPVSNAIKSGMERGLLDMGRAEAALNVVSPQARMSVADHLAPLLTQWTDAGLLVPHYRFHKLTRAGRFWQVAMTGRLLTWLGQH